MLIELHKIPEENFMFVDTNFKKIVEAVRESRKNSGGNKVGRMSASEFGLSAFACQPDDLDLSARVVDHMVKKLTANCMFGYMYDSDWDGSLDRSKIVFMTPDTPPEITLELWDVSQLREIFGVVDVGMMDVGEEFYYAGKRWVVLEQVPGATRCILSGTLNGVYRYGKETNCWGRSELRSFLHNVLRNNLLERGANEGDFVELRTTALSLNGELDPVTEDYISLPAVSDLARAPEIFGNDDHWLINPFSRALGLPYQELKSLSSTVAYFHSGRVQLRDIDVESRVRPVIHLAPGLMVEPVKK